jgi:hypothetical protein
MRSLPLDPDEMRLFERGARESPYASRSPSPSCQNVANHFEDMCFRSHYVSSSNIKSAYMVVSLVIYSLLTALSLVIVEWMALEVTDPKDPKEHESDVRRGEFLRRFARFQYYLPVESNEWAVSTTDLLKWYELQLYDDVGVPKWNLTSALAFVGAVGSTVGRLPGKRVMACQCIFNAQFFRSAHQPFYERRPTTTGFVVTAGDLPVLLLCVDDRETIRPSAEAMANDDHHHCALRGGSVRVYGSAALYAATALCRRRFRRAVHHWRPIGQLSPRPIILRVRLSAVALLRVDLCRCLCAPCEQLEAVGVRARRGLPAH